MDCPDYEAIMPFGVSGDGDTHDIADRHFDIGLTKVLSYRPIKKMSLKVEIAHNL